MKIQVFDPPMCCSTGVCGPSVDPDLARFAADLEWLTRQGVIVERFNLSQQPSAFASAPLVKEALAKDGLGCLPMIVVDGVARHQGSYPTREVLAGYVGLEVRPGVFTDAVRELVAIGAAIAANCEVCFKHHYNEARKLGVSNEDMCLAVETAHAVKERSDRSVVELADRYLSVEPVAASSGCCGPSPESEASTSAGRPGTCCG
jgi:AhpD family alkylhydroperoxidase